ncbi:peptidase S13 [Knoellia sinensis KCTC 19936]|uniref:Peptidase S13 n=1 Tax=Knoellia sinensis KCTC 19936 TaxID=1385520 RepID=A0A0A0JDN4_9MICO|nr:D-alanyl-D-alanine carboxypeptidase/D-alanyl-D-alanine-endopeptidase [Knoellia sinensis]KGN34137.1 peptidase S13 [Knoellia sinensis KCTC 19936]
MMPTIRARGPLSAAAAITAAAALMTSAPAGAVGAVGKARPAEPFRTAVADPRPESAPRPDTPQEILRDRQGASQRGALVGTIPERLAKAGVDPALGSGVSAVVLDAMTGEVIYSRNPSLALMPASNEKLNTAVVALRSMGAKKTFRTEVLTDATRTTLWLKGGGDPSLPATEVRRMAGTARAALAAAGRTSVAVRVDDSRFPAPTNAVGWKDSYLPGDVAPVRALVVDGRNLMDTSMDAGAVFRNELVRLGLTVTSLEREVAPASATRVDLVKSPPLATLVAQMLNGSSNDYAETFHRQSSLFGGHGATWAEANAHSVATLKSVGVNMSGAVIEDGSGLSRADRMSGANMASVLRAISQNRALESVIYRHNALPTAGVSGTLASRFAQPETVCARGRVRAKTGSLSDAVALSGTAYGVDGRKRIFSIIENGAADNAAARFAIERFATAATGCDPA